MNVSFAPLRQDAVAFLATTTGIDYAAQWPFAGGKWFCVTGRDDEGNVAGVILCEFINWFEAVVNVAVADRRFVTRRLLRAVFAALFSKAVRLTAFVDVGNGHAIRNTLKLGFVHEGYCRMGINGVRDAYTFGMLKSDCRFLPGHAGITPTMMGFDNGQGRTLPA